MKQQHINALYDIAQINSEIENLSNAISTFQRIVNNSEVVSEYATEEQKKHYAALATMCSEMKNALTKAKISKMQFVAKHIEV